MAKMVNRRAVRKAKKPLSKQQKKDIVVIAILVVIFIVAIIVYIRVMKWIKGKAKFGMNTLALEPKDDASIKFCDQDEAATYGHELFIKCRNKWDAAAPVNEKCRQKGDDFLVRVSCAIEMKTGFECEGGKNLKSDECSGFEQSECANQWVPTDEAAILVSKAVNGDNADWVGMGEMVHKVYNSFLDNKPLFKLVNANTNTSTDINS